jgi:hypothetical protein
MKIRYFLVLCLKYFNSYQKDKFLPQIWFCHKNFWTKIIFLWKLSWSEDVLIRSDHQPLLSEVSSSEDNLIISCINQKHLHQKITPSEAVSPETFITNLRRWIFLVTDWLSLSVYVFNAPRAVRLSRIIKAILYSLISQTSEILRWLLCL